MTKKAKNILYELLSDSIQKCKDVACDYEIDLTNNELLKHHAEFQKIVKELNSKIKEYEYVFNELKFNNS